jgi:diguanylate cyclase (GGDEF)-like protein
MLNTMESLSENVRWPIDGIGGLVFPSLSSGEGRKPTAEDHALVLVPRGFDQVLLGKLLDHIREAVILFDRNHSVLGWNRAAEALLELGENRIDLNWLCQRITQPPKGEKPQSSPSVSMRMAIEKNLVWNQSALINLAERSPIPVDVQLVPMTTPGNQVIGNLMMLHDATYKVNLQQEVEQLRVKTISDPLTGVANRAEFERILESCCHHSRSSKSNLSLIICDIDHFKSINDEYGHAVGDQALVMFASFLQKSVREADFVARFGGEEFVILCYGCTGLAAMERAEKIRARLEKSALGCLGQNCLTASFGVAQFNPSDSISSFFDRADRALLRAKESGRNRVIIGERASNGEMRLISVPVRESWQPGNVQLLTHQFTTSNPFELLVVKILGFVEEHQASITMVEPKRMVIHTRGSSGGFFRRNSDRRVSLAVDLQFREESRKSDQSKQSPNIRIHIGVDVVRHRDRRCPDVEQQAERMVLSLCSYLMLNPGDSIQ